MGKPLVRFCEGLDGNVGMDEILWHRRETRRQTENTQRIRQPGESPAYSNSPDIKRRTKVAVRNDAERRPCPHGGKAAVLREATGTCTARAAGVEPALDPIQGVQARREGCAETTSGRSSSQQGLTATCIDLVSEGTTEARGGGRTGA